MLTIAGSGINLYSLNELAGKISFDCFDCIIADINFDNDNNKSLIPANVDFKFAPFKDVRTFIKDNFINGRKILYIVTGSPLFFSATGIIIKYLKDEIPDFDEQTIEILPSESSRDYLLKKLKLLENNVTSLSLHGKNISTLDLNRFLLSKYTFLICDANSLYDVFQYTKYFQDDLVFYIGSKLGSPEEKIEILDLENTINDFSPAEFKDLYHPYVLLIEKKYDDWQQISNNQDFVTNAGMLTKTDKRVLTLQALELKSNLTMWDIGAGSGSVSIDAYKIFKIRSILFEKNKEQCEFIKKNLAKHKVVGAELIEGDALKFYKDTPKPDRIFIGGGGTEVLSGIIEIFSQLNEDGILVANIVVLENLATVVETLKNTDIKYEIKSIDISHYKKISATINLSISEPERTLFQVIMKK